VMCSGNATTRVSTDGGRTFAAHHSPLPRGPAPHTKIPGRNSTVATTIAADKSDNLPKPGVEWSTPDSWHYTFHPSNHTVDESRHATPTVWRNFPFPTWSFRVLSGGVTAAPMGDPLKPHRDYISEETLRLVERRQRRYVAWKRAGKRKSGHQYEALKDARKAVKAAIRKDNATRWEKFAKEVTEAFDDGDICRGYKALRGAYKPRERMPHRRDKSIAEEGARHFEELLRSDKVPPVEETIPLKNLPIDPGVGPKERARTALRGPAFTDGGCRDNGTPTAKAGYGVYFGEGDKRNECGGVPGEQTNVRAETFAFLRLLQLTSGPVDHVGDYLEVVTNVNAWRFRLRQGTNFEGLTDGDLWREIAREMEGREVRSRHVNSHQETSEDVELNKLIEGNNGADVLATQGIDKEPTPLDATEEPVPTAKVRDETPDDKEITEALARVKNTSPGSDGVPIRVVKESKELTQMLVDLVKLCWETGTVPQMWAEMYIVAIPKKPSAKALDEHRGIALLQTTSKVLSQIVLWRLQHVPCGTEQHGFRRGRRTLGPIAVAKNVMQEARRTRRGLVLVFVDITKAYDSIFREVLWETLTQAGVSERLLALIKRTYEDDIRCKMDGWVSRRHFRSTRGLKQGCLLSPLLFNLVLARILASVELKGIRWKDGSTLEHLEYADDLVMLCNNASEAQANLDKLAAVFATAGLTISTEKTKWMRMSVEPRRRRGRRRRGAEPREEAEPSTEPSPEPTQPSPEPEVESEPEPEPEPQEPDGRWVQCGDTTVLLFGDGKCPAFGCKYTGKEPKQLTQHLKRHAGWEKVSCRRARPNYTWKEGESRQACPECNKQFETEEKCRSHRRNKVCLRERTRQRTESGGRNLACVNCGKAFRNIVSRINHMRKGVCNGGVPVEAEQCGAITKKGTPCMKNKPCPNHTAARCGKCGEETNSLPTHRCLREGTAQVEPTRAPEIMEEEVDAVNVIRLYGEPIDKVDRFRYLGRILTEADTDEEDVSARIATASKTLAALQRGLFGPPASRRRRGC
jgi:ribonuclease HI